MLVVWEFYLICDHMESGSELTHALCHAGSMGALFGMWSREVTIGAAPPPAMLVIWEFSIERILWQIKIIIIIFF